MVSPHSLSTPGLLARLSSAESVLMAGAGGGFDVFAGLPLALALMAQGKRVHFSNLTFTNLGGTDVRWLVPHLARVTPHTVGESYFPERALSQWLHGRGLDASVYAFEKVGVVPMRAGYEHLRELLGLDAIVLVDGGTDILMRGDEAGLGTPEEDMTSLCAVSKLDVPTKLIACIGFGVDAYHGVCHAHFLENVAALEAEGGYLGAFSVPRESAEGQGFLDAVSFAHRLMPERVSIVNGSIAAAMRGAFGNAQFTLRTRNAELFINPLMSIYFGFELEAVARRSLYLSMLEGTRTIFDVGVIIEAFRHSAEARPRRLIPH